MTVTEAVAKLLSLLEQTDEIDYTRVEAEMHIRQAMYELSDEITVSGLNQFSQFTIDNSLADQDYHAIVPGRMPIVEALGTSLSEFSHMYKCWLDFGGETQAFKATTVTKLLDEYGDTVGQPKKYAVDGQYLYWRPYVDDDDSTSSFTIRARWASLPSIAGAEEEPVVLAQAPFATIYRAATIASMWLLDDDRATRFENLSGRAIGLFAIRNTMENDEDNYVEEYDGEAGF